MGQPPWWNESPAITDVPRVGRGRTVQAVARLDEEQAPTVLAVRARVSRNGFAGTRVGDGQPVVSVGRPQNEFDEVPVLPAGTVTDGVGEQLRGQQAQVVAEVWASGSDSVTACRARRTEAGWAGKRQWAGMRGTSGMANFAHL